MFSIKIVKNSNTQLNQIVITNNKLNFSCSIYPNLGASLQKLKINTVDLIDGITCDTNGLTTYNNAFKSSFLFPYPNRIENGYYNFNGTNYEFFCNDTVLNNAIHGHIYNKPFKIIHKNSNEKEAKITLSYVDQGTTQGFPFPFNIEIIYIISAQKISIDFNVFNSGKTSFPFGIGWHPYFKVENLYDSVLSFEGISQYKLNSNMIPENTINIKHPLPLKVENTQLDDCYVLENNRSYLNTTKYNLEIDFSESEDNNFLQIYTPPNRKNIAIEPMTCAPNTFNNKNGLLILNPSETFKWNINLHYNKQ
jgi:aldose 1-epimerase